MPYLNSDFIAPRRHERGATLPDIQSLQLLAGVFGVTVDELLGGDADELAREAANDRRV